MILTSLLCTPVFAQDPEIEHETRINVIVADDVSDQATRIDWTTNDPNIDFMNMQVGESQSIVDESGRNILVTKEEAGLRFNIDGESVFVPDMGEAHSAHMTLVAADSGAIVDHDVDIEIIDGSSTATATSVAAPAMSGATIMTKEPLDAATQESIRSILLSAGENNVKFVDSGKLNRQIKVIRKQVEVVN